MQSYYSLMANMSSNLHARVAAKGYLRTAVVAPSNIILKNTEISRGKEEPTTKVFQASVVRDVALYNRL